MKGVEDKAKSRKATVKRNERIRSKAVLDALNLEEENDEPSSVSSEEPSPVSSETKSMDVILKRKERNIQRKKN